MKKLKLHIRRIVIWPIIQILRIIFLFKDRSHNLNPRMIRKILVYAPMGIGNMVLFIPTLKAIREKFSMSKIWLLVSRGECKELIDGGGLVDNIIYFPVEKSGIIKKMRFIWRLRKQRFQLLISNFLGEGVFLTLLSTFGGIPHRVGHVTSPGWRNNKDFINNIKVKMGENEHEIDRNLRLVYSLGIKEDRIDKEPFIVIDKRSKKYATDFFKRNNIDTNMVIGVQIGAGASWKQWGLDNFAQLCDKLVNDYNAKIILFGGPNELNLAEYVLEKMNNVPINAVGETSIKEAAALIGKCDLFICNDSGLGKISIAMNTPTVTIWGPSDWPRARAWKSGHLDIRKNLPCSPCYTMSLESLSQVESCKHRKCLKLITVDDVLIRIGKLTGRTPLKNKDSE